ncbi:hypothetical protein [Streptomyces antibioticus]|uniref:hypothetical protein n=1 Tax=Streptomyces antibioticus TaxID=1890 RepID=UPI0036BA709E
MGLDFIHTGVRRLRTLITDAEVRRLRAQLAAAVDRARRLDEQLAALQAANEGAYRELRQATGGPRFDTSQPFGQIPATRGGVQ